MRKTGIICTIGPASGDDGELGRMRAAGMDVARLNFSHGTLQSHLNTIKKLRGLNKKGRSIKILQDLEGYRVRIGKLSAEEGITLHKGGRVFLSNSPDFPADEQTVPFDYEGPLEKIRKGSNIYIDDGQINLRVLGSDKERIEAEVVVPGVLKSSKGVNIPGEALEFKGIKDKDRRDIEFGLKNGVDFIAQSFVRGKDDIIKIREFAAEYGNVRGIIAKIECRQGIDNIDEIIEVSDGIMIARGDMGVSVPVYRIPIIQKAIIKKCNREKKFVITATQMLESMTSYPVPTRAEVSDVANAVIDGSDYLMLSGETAVGRDPAGTVGMMKKIIDFTISNLEGSQSGFWG